MMSEFQKAWNRQADLRILEWLQAAAEDTRQRELTVSLGQVECGRAHGAMLAFRSCPDCKAVL